MRVVPSKASSIICFRTAFKSSKLKVCNVVVADTKSVSSSSKNANWRTIPRFEAIEQLHAHEVPKLRARVHLGSHQGQASEQEAPEVL